MAQVLEHLTPEASIAFVAEKAKSQDVEWLGAMKDAGFFNLPDNADVYERFAVSNPRFKVKSGGFEWISALAGVVDGADFESDSITSAHRREKPVTLEASDAFKSFLSDVVTTLTTQVEALKEKSKHLTVFDPYIPMADTVHRENVEKYTRSMQYFRGGSEKTCSALLHAACAIDDAKTVDLLLQGNVDLFKRFSPVDVLGKVAEVIKHKDHASMAIGPAMTAMLFSSHAALDMMESHGMGIQSVLASRAKQGWDLPTQDPLKKALPNTLYGITALDAIAMDALPCKPDMLARVLDAFRQEAAQGVTFGPDADGPLFKRAYGLLKSQRTSYEDEVKKTWTRSGVYDIEVPLALNAAVFTFDLDVVKHMEPSIDWGRALLLKSTQGTRSESIFDHAMNKTYTMTQDGRMNNESKNSEAMVLLLMDMAKKAGHGPALYEGDVYPSKLVGYAIEKNHMQVLSKAMENGIDPHKPLAGGESPMAMAERLQRGEAKQMMGAFVSTQKARDFVAECEAPKAVAPKP